MRTKYANRPPYAFKFKYLYISMYYILLLFFCIVFLDIYNLRMFVHFCLCRSNSMYSVIPANISEAFVLGYSFIRMLYLVLIQTKAHTHEHKIYFLRMFSYFVFSNPKVLCIPIEDVLCQMEIWC